MNGADGVQEIKKDMCMMRGARSGAYVSELKGALDDECGRAAVRGQVGSSLEIGNYMCGVRLIDGK